MHELEPFYRWQNVYDAFEDTRSPFFEAVFSPEDDLNTVYNYVLHPDWDYFGSETLYLKLLYVDYDMRFCVIEMIGEWNDTLHNDVMHLKRNIIDPLIQEGIHKFILIGENVLNFHGLEDDYYQEWFEDVEDGWIVAMNFREFVHQEWEKYRLDYYLSYGGNLDMENWRTFSAAQLFQLTDGLMQRRLEPPA